MNAKKQAGDDNPDENPHTKPDIESLRSHYEEELDALRRSYELLKHDEEKYRLAYKSSPDAILITRLSDGKNVSVNDGFTSIMGYSEQEALGRTTLEMNIWKDPDERKLFISKLQETGVIKDFEARFISKGGDIIYGRISASVLNLDGIPHILSVTHDITESRIANMALEKEQFLINALMSNLSDHVYFKDINSRFIRNNIAHARSFGIDDPGELIGKSDFDFFTDEAAQSAYNDEQEIIKTGKPILKEEKLVRKNCETVWFSVIKMPLRDLHDNIIGTFGISRDITENKKTEEQLSLLANALKSVNECVSITDMNDRVLFLNKAFLDTYGFTDIELHEASITKIRSENNPPELTNEILPATLAGGWHGELLNRKKDGTEFLVSLSTAVAKDDKGNPTSLIGVASDITSRKRTELENQVLLEITQGITTTSNLDELLKLIHNSLGKVVYAENIFVALFDKTTGLFDFPYFIDKIDEKPLPVSLAHSCTMFVYKSVKPLVLTQEVFDILVEEGEVELIGTNSPSWIGVPLQTPSEVIGVMVLQHYEKENVYSESDVDFLVSIGSQIAIAIARKKSEEEITRKNDELLTANAEKDKFFSILAHDLRGPLSAFVSATQILNEEAPSMTPDDISEITNSMTKSATNIFNLLENLLEWSRLKRDGIDFLPVRLSLKECITESVILLYESAFKKGISIRDLTERDIIVEADKHMLLTVIRNLLSNAVKFSNDGAMVTIEALRTGDDMAEISVKDTGIGMNEELISRLFKINGKTSRNGTAGETSTGLGLLLCKEFVEKGGGSIKVESKMGTGSIFSFTVRLLKENTPI
jgi:PAS domain S-box-containing protein